MDYSPLEDKILIKPIKKEIEIKEGQIITDWDSKKKEVLEGEVFAVGNGRYATETGVFMENVLRKGDVVLYGANAGVDLSIANGDGKLTEMKLMREGDVLLVIKKSS